MAFTLVGIGLSCVVDDIIKSKHPETNSNSFINWTRVARITTQVSIIGVGVALDVAVVAAAVGLVASLIFSGAFAATLGAGITVALNVIALPVILTVPEIYAAAIPAAGLALIGLISHKRRQPPPQPSYSGSGSSSSRAYGSSHVRSGPTRSKPVAPVKDLKRPSTEAKNNDWIDYLLEAKKYMDEYNQYVDDYIAYIKDCQNTGTTININAVPKEKAEEAQSLLFEILGLQENQIESKVTSAKKKLLFKIHPDRNKDNENASAASKFLNELHRVAYPITMDQEHI